MKTIITRFILIALTSTGFSVMGFAQQITGIWKGKVKSTHLELKIIKSGDSLTGTSYYYSSKNNYRRYSIKGYFDPETNDVVWWDDQFISGGNPAANEASLHVADFNCPGEDKMMLDGNSSVRDNKDISKGPLHLQKTGSTSFPDEWDWVIDNYIAGANDPYIIDSIGHLAMGPTPFPEEKEIPAASVLRGSPQKTPDAPLVKAPAVITEKNAVAKKRLPTRRNLPAARISYRW